MGINSAAQISPKVEGTRVRVLEKLELAYETVITAGAVSVSTPLTLIASTGADALTLANGYPGQVKTIIMTTDGGTATLTPTSFANGTTITFDDVYDMWQGVFVLGAWYNIGTPTATVA